jgi:hypothetical protein
MSSANRSPDLRRAGARILDTAEGVLITLRACTLNEAFVEIVGTAKSHNVSTFSLADALVAIAQTPSCNDTEDAAFVAARDAWGDLFDRIRPNSAVSPTPRQPDDEDDEGDELASGA